MSTVLTFLIGMMCGGVIATVAVCMCVIGSAGDNEKGD